MAQTNVQKCPVCSGRGSIEITDSDCPFCNGTGEFTKDAKDIIPADKKNAVQLVAEMAPDQLPVNADKSRIYEVIANLLSNAIKFTSVGNIVIRAERHERAGRHYALVTIVDAGTGIDPEIMPRLFTKFASKSDQGTGLGLFISKNIVEAHGGRIWGEDNNDGTGATFAFTLPLAVKGSPV